VLAVTPPTHAVAQDYEPPAHVSYAEGIVTLERESESEQAGAGAVVLPGDRLRTSAGRAEILFPDGTSLAIDEFTVVDLMDRALLRLTAGRARLTVPGAADPAAALRYQIDTPSSSVSTEGPGEYRVAVVSYPSGTETQLSVLHGYAVIATNQEAVRVRSGEQSTARDGFAPSFPRSFNVARYDEFDRWADQRREERMGYRGASSSAQYLPADLRVYGGTLDSYGTWQQEPDYGQVWYPTVAPAWRPYYHGSWSSVPGYGWTWRGLDRWAWPTHHYGRWGHRGARWFWIPGRHWGPAWVSWGVAPGYVGWCPLGFNNRPVFAMSVSTGYAWNGWVAMPRGRFGAHGAFVHREAVHHRALGSTPFITQAHPPVAVPLAARNGRARGGNAAAYRLGAPVPNQSLARMPGTVNGQRSTPATPTPPSAVPIGPGGGRPVAASRNRGIDASQRAAPGVITGGRPGVVARTPSGGAPGPTMNPYSGTGVIRANRGRSGSPDVIPGISGGSSAYGPTPGRSGAVRRGPAPPPAVLPREAQPRQPGAAVLPREAPPRQPGAAALPREAPPRQQPVAAPSHEASAPASSSGAAAASPRRGSGAGDSGRARRR
jgi:hypothetical protein